MTQHTDNAGDYLTIKEVVGVLLVTCTERGGSSSVAITTAELRALCDEYDEAHPPGREIADDCILHRKTDGWTHDSLHIRDSKPDKHGQVAGWLFNRGASQTPGTGEYAVLPLVHLPGTYTHADGTEIRL